MEKTGTLSQKKRVTRKTGVENNVTQENTNKAGHDRKRAISHSERYKMIADAAYSALKVEVSRTMSIPLLTGLPLKRKSMRFSPIWRPICL